MSLTNRYQKSTYFLCSVATPWLLGLSCPISRPGPSPKTERLKNQEKTKQILNLSYPNPTPSHPQGWDWTLTALICPEFGDLRQSRLWFFFPPEIVVIYNPGLRYQGLFFSSPLLEICFLYCNSQQFWNGLIRKTSLRLPENDIRPSNSCICCFSLLFNRLKVGKGKRVLRTRSRKE